ncbi:uncharacterized protein BXZ73DRAFT_110737 [Epithele typhae]|uniref:uncharacterized protein n=1 Tax=Epithele typhae TaxID=378194 RepID=UPI002007E9C9|nr:uncharacterized protein BXZ73DRAFT_110737 [Epithele typhae]KAH9906084.1 hypothetical protein BXZ73DRAFT_110737 [Epithele typhae]
MSSSCDLDLPWFLYVGPSPSPSPSPTLALAALMTALHAHLHTPIAADDYNASARDPEGVLDICRTDDLTDRRMLWGLWKVSSGEGEEAGRARHHTECTGLDG